MSRSSLMTTSSSESPGEPFTVIFSPSLLTKCTVTLLSDLKVGNEQKKPSLCLNQHASTLKITAEQRWLARTKVSLYHPPVVTTHYCNYEVRCFFLVCFLLRFVCESCCFFFVFFYLKLQHQRRFFFFFNRFPNHANMFLAWESTSCQCYTVVNTKQFYPSKQKQKKKWRQLFNAMIFSTWTRMFWVFFRSSEAFLSGNERDKHSSPDYPNQVGIRFSNKKNSSFVPQRIASFRLLNQDHGSGAV